MVSCMTAASGGGKPSAVLAANLEHYDRAYQDRGRLRDFLRIRLSFDQQYKRKINWRLLKRRFAAERPVRRAFEVGFGFGLVLRGLPTDVSVYGTEISGAAVRRLQSWFDRQGRDATFRVHDSTEALPFEGPFDVIVCSHVLEHVPDDVALLAEFRRLLSRDGVLLLNVPINEPVPDVKHLRPYDRNILGRTLEAAGLRMVRSLEADRWATFFLAHPPRHTYVRRLGRAALAILPFAVGEAIADWFLPYHAHGQLAVLAVACEPEGQDQ